MAIAGTPIFTIPAGTAAGGAEVAAVNAAGTTGFILGPNGVDVIDTATGALRYGIPKADLGLSLGSGNSVAIRGDTLAVTFDGSPAGTPGTVAIYQVTNTGANLVRTVTVGATPDQITFTPDGTRLLVAIEGEPTANYTSDPAGGVAIIDVATGVASFSGFASFDSAALRAAGVRLTGAATPGGAPNTALAEFDLEPEYITVAPDGRTAYVTLQEANAIGVLNLDAGNGPVGFTGVLPLGLKDHALAGNGLDTSDRDGGFKLTNPNVKGLYQPDGVALFEQDGKRYLVTANEGDAREWGSFVEEIRVGDAAYVLDPTLFPNAAALKADTALGRLTVSRHTGDTDGDGDFDQIHVFGGRSFSIWEVAADDSGLTQVYDSGSLIETIIGSRFPALLDDGRSDNKGPEPEHVTLATIDGALHALVGLERSNAVMAFRIDGPADVTYAGTIQNPGDVAPEVFTTFTVNGQTKLLVPSETSGTTTAYDLAPPATGNYTLQILHASDFEAGLAAGSRADRFAAIVDKLEDQVANSITLSSGDNFIPSPFNNASADPSVRDELQSFYRWLLNDPTLDLSGLREGQGRVDIAIMNALGVQASAIGNHEWDLGAQAFVDAIDTIAGTSGSAAARVSAIGAMFPYLSANLDFSNDAAVRALFTATLRDAASYATTRTDLSSNNNVAAEAADAQIAPWATINEGGQTIGVLGVTTQLLKSLSSIGGVQVRDPAGDGGVDNMDELATILQPLVDQMTAQGLNKIVLLSHLQQYQNELLLATKLSGVDVIVAGGSHAVFADGDDALRPGDAAAQGYPVFRTGADGKPVAIVNTGSEYGYVGRLVVTFDANGDIVPASVDPAVSGAIATTDENVAKLWGTENPYADGTRGGEVRKLTDAVSTVVNAKDGNVFGYTATYLEGRRAEVRTEETNLGNLSADANLFVAKQVDAGVMVSIKNGGGIRAEIGSLTADAVPREIAPVANPGADKPEGGVSQLDIENALRFNNSLSIVTVTAANFERILEHAVAAVAPGATPGAFGQVGGLSFSFDPTLQGQILGAGGSVTTEGLRIRNAAILNEDGSVADVLVQDGVLVGDAARTIKFATLTFLATGNGDGYPISDYALSRVDLLNDPALGTGAAGFAAAGSEQDAMAEYLAARHGTLGTAYNEADLGPAGDTRIQNLSQRPDNVLSTALGGGDDGETLSGTAANETITAGAGDDTITASGGRDVVLGGGGFDTLDFSALRGRGDGGVVTGSASNTGIGFTWVSADGVTASSWARDVERVTFVDGAIELSGTADAVKVSFLYDFVLNRPADALGLGFYTEALKEGASLADVASALLAASDLPSLGSDVVVDRAFDALVGRAVTTAERDQLSDLLDSGTIDLTTLAVALTDLDEAAAFRSAEVANIGVAWTDYDMAGIAHGYELLLGRDAEAEGLRFWNASIDAGVRLSQIYETMIEVSGPTTGLANFSDEAFVEFLYRGALGRTAEAEGATFWEGQLASGISRGEVAEAIMTVPGFSLNAVDRIAQTGTDLI